MPLRTRQRRQNAAVSHRPVGHQPRNAALELDSAVHFGLRVQWRLSCLDRYGGVGDGVVEFGRGPVFVTPWVAGHRGGGLFGRRGSENDLCAQRVPSEWSSTEFEFDRVRPSSTDFTNVTAQLIESVSL